MLHLSTPVLRHGPTRSSATFKKGFTLLELIVVVVVLAVLALVAVPTFSGAINETSSEVGLRTAEGIAKEANALAAFNGGSAVNQTEFSNIQSATLAADLDPAEGWAFEIGSSIDGSYIALSKNGTTQCWSITVDTSQTPDRAAVAELFDETVAAADPCPSS